VSLAQSLVNGLHSLCVAHNPHLTILLDLPATVAQRRVGQRNLQRRSGGRYHASKQDRFESQGLRFAKKLRRGYLDVASQMANCAVVNGNTTPEKVAGRVLQVCERWIPEFEQLLKAK
jgi:thymidylate kinase